MNTKTGAIFAASFALVLGGAQAEPIKSAETITVAATQASASETLQRAAKQALAAYLELWKSPDTDAMASTFKEDAVLEYSLYIPEINSEIRGRESMINSVQAIAQLGRDWKFDHIQLFPTLSPNTYFAQYTASGTMVATGEQFERNVIVVLEFDGERVSRLRELFNPAIALASASARELSKVGEQPSKHAYSKLTK